jgi:ankyrin repeat and LEM domain-containing protein 1
LIVLLEKHAADPNVIIPKLQIAPIHYAVGFDNLEFAEIVTERFLKKKADPNLLSESDGLRPLHIACIWGREKIVKMLLDSGGDLDLRCSDNQTPINYAIHENHFKVIETIQKFVFEKKIEKKRRDLILKSKHLEELKNEETFSTPIKNNHLKNAIQSLDEKKFTPNRINYNFDVTSPYYIGITHRRHKTSRENSRVVDEDEPETAETSSKKNLFELTQRNLKEFSEQMSQVIVIDRLAIHKRRSYIKDWREKIQHIRNSTDCKLDIDYINYLNSCNDVTLMKKSPDSSIVEEVASSNDSFTTAKSDLQRFENAIRPLPDYTEVIQENYVHSDAESGVVLFERRIVSKNKEHLKEIEELEDAQSQSSVSTKVTIPPLDYDTDVLRNELKSFGGNPGPITKNTKKLYLKQLVKIRKRPEIAAYRKNVLKGE